MGGARRRGGAGRRERKRASWRALRGRRGCEALPARHSDFAVCPAADLGGGWRRSPEKPSPKAAAGRLPPRPREAPLPRRRRAPELRVKRRRTSVPKLKSKSRRGQALNSHLGRATCGPLNGDQQPMLPVRVGHRQGECSGVASPVMCLTCMEGKPIARI